MAMTPAATGSRKGKPRAVPVINVTPLVDVILVVLIIFMLVTPMMMKTFWLNIPKAAEAEQENKKDPAASDDAKKPLVATVSASGESTSTSTSFQRARLNARLPRLLAAKENKVLYFDAADDAPYGVAAEAMDLCRSAGARSIAIMSQPVVQ
ncbi:MAG: biopolymer transporter ExbD [Myxococcales bacterium]|nr:biopolymer transporter ExbD [Myxococcales bacterium]